MGSACDMTPALTHRPNAGVADVERLSPEENLARKFRDEAALRKDRDRSFRFALCLCLAGAVVIAGRPRDWPYGVGAIACGILLSG
jgi:hypothetical protein